MEFTRTATLVTAALLTSLVSAQTTDEWSASVLKAMARKQPLPAIGAKSFDATERLAYEVQRAVVDELVKGGDTMVGHKLGLTSEAAQAQYDLFEPVHGTLLKSHLKNTATFVSMRRFRGMVVEMEIGFELKLSIRSEPRSIDELKAKVRQVLPIVELPNVHFEPGAEVTGTDIIASNVAAATVIKGRGKPLSTLELREVSAQLTCNGEVVTEGTGTDAMGDDPWAALLWLVQERLRNGHEVKRNDLLITGALGQVVPAEAGRYVADFGKLGRVTFSMR